MTSHTAYIGDRSGRGGDVFNLIRRRADALSSISPLGRSNLNAVEIEETVLPEKAVPAFGERGHETDGDVVVHPTADFEGDLVEVVVAALTLDAAADGALLASLNIKCRGARRARRGKG